MRKQFRVNESLNEEIDRSGMNVTEVARGAVQRELVRRAAGVCAACGDLVYQGGEPFTRVGGGTPLATFLGLGNDRPVDLCGPCADAAVEAFEQGNEHGRPSFDYVWDAHRQVSDRPVAHRGNLPADAGEGPVAWYMGYATEVEAVKGAQPGEPASALVSERERITSKMDSLADEHPHALWVSFGLWLATDSDQPDGRDPAEAEVYNDAMQRLDQTEVDITVLYTENGRRGCPSCGTLNGMEDYVCSGCGGPLDECEACGGRPVYEESGTVQQVVVCDDCGARLIESEPPGA